MVGGFFLRQASAHDVPALFTGWDNTTHRPGNGPVPPSPPSPSPTPPAPPTHAMPWSYRGLRWRDVSDVTSTNTSTSTSTSSVGSHTDLSYTEWCNGETELYNITADPYQLLNLAPSLKGSDLLQRLAATLATVAGCTGETCPGRQQVPIPDPTYVRKPFKCVWPAP